MNHEKGESMKRGQMSLEMIIGLLILLVVAVVVIRIFLKTMSDSADISKVKDSLKWKEFKSQCEGICNDFKLTGSRATLAKYCYTKMGGDTDLNKNGMVDAIPADTDVLEICEDGVYCFHVFDCRSETDIIGWDDCRRVVCDEWAKHYTDTQLDQKVLSLFPSEGSCVLAAGENWWDMYFGPAPCTNAPVASLSLRSISECTVSPLGTSDSQGRPEYSFSCSGIEGVSSCAGGVVIFNDENDDGAAATYGGDPTDIFGSVSISGTGLSGVAVVPKNDDGTLRPSPVSCANLVFTCVNWAATNPDDFQLYEIASDSCVMV